MEEDKILIDRKTLKAISSDTRMDLLKLLAIRKYTLSELSKKTNLKNPTIKEHLDHLIDASLVKREESNNKWKYYSLTEKGQKLVNPKKVKILISFVISLLATFGLIGYYIFNFASKLGGVNNAFSYDTAMVTTDTIARSVASPEAMAKTADVINQTTVAAINNSSSFNNEIIIIIAIFFLAALTIFLLVLSIKEKRENKKNCVEIID